MARTIYIRSGTIGGGNNLDGIDGANLQDGDIAFVFTSGNGFYPYILDADNGGTESDPTLIEPDDNPGSKRWVIQDCYT